MVKKKYSRNIFSNGIDEKIADNHHYDNGTFRNFEHQINKITKEFEISFLKTIDNITKQRIEQFEVNIANLLIQIMKDVSHKAINADTKINNINNDASIKKMLTELILSTLL